MSDQNFKEKVKYAGILTTFEVGLGSILHGFKIPLSGHFLSLNQQFWLTRLQLKTKENKSAFEVSKAVCLLKSLSPAGKKLTPMLAISMQGLLFSLPQYFLGVNFFTLWLGGILLSTWTFIQPIVLYLLIFGKNLIELLNHLIEKTNAVITFLPENIYYVLGVLFVIKIVFSSLVYTIAIKMTSTKEQVIILKASEKFSISNSTENKKSFIKGLINDLTQPLFIGALLLTGIFLIYVESDQTKIIWGLLRPIAMALILFSILRLTPPEKLLGYFKKDSETKKILENIISKIK